jgi:hypothetical protein
MMRLRLEWDDNAATVVFNRAFSVTNFDRLYLFSRSMIPLLPAARFESERQFMSISHAAYSPGQRLRMTLSAICCKSATKSAEIELKYVLVLSSRTFAASDRFVLVHPI